LVEIVAGADLPHLHIGAIETDTVVPQHEYLVGLPGTAVDQKWSILAIR
jgi:hypothetical protein